MDVIDAPIGHFSMAEALMAAAENKRAAYRPRMHEDDDPLGETAVPAAPECGPDETGALQAEALVTHISAAASLERIGRQIMIQRGKAPESISASDHLKLGQTLRRDRKMKKRAYYVIARNPEEEGERSELQEVMRFVRKKLPTVATLIIDPALVNEVDEDRVHWLKNTIPLAKRGRK